MTDQAPSPTMTPQPYPLYAAVLTSSNHINYGRVIGWVDNRANGDGDEDRAHDWLPVVAYQDTDGGIYHTAAVTDGVDLYLSEVPGRAVDLAEARKATHPKNTPTLTVADLRKVWPEVVNRITKTNRRVGMLVRDVSVDSFDGAAVTVTTRSPVLAQMLTDGIDLLRDALYEELGGRWEIRVRSGEDSAR